MNFLNVFNKVFTLKKVYTQFLNAKNAYNNYYK
jgi:hypothetical protein